MTDKDVTRNVRSSGEEGVETPTERHYHSIGEKKTFPFGEKVQKSEEKKRIVEKFREREKRLREEQRKKGS